MRRGFEERFELVNEYSITTHVAPLFSSYTSTLPPLIEESARTSAVLDAGGIAAEMRSDAADAGAEGRRAAAAAIADAAVAAAATKVSPEQGELDLLEPAASDPPQDPMGDVSTTGQGEQDLLEVPPPPTTPAAQASRGGPGISLAVGEVRPQMPASGQSLGDGSSPATSRTIGRTIARGLLKITPRPPTFRPRSGRAASPSPPREPNPAAAAATSAAAAAQIAAATATAAAAAAAEAAAAAAEAAAAAAAFVAAGVPLPPELLAARGCERAAGAAPPAAGADLAQSLEA